MPTKTPRGKKDLSSATYLDRLGRESARAYAFVISAQASREGVALPRPDDEVNQFLDNTIEALEKQEKLPWSKLSNERMIVFIDAWVDEMNRLGIRG